MLLTPSLGSQEFCEDVGRSDLDVCQMPWDEPPAFSDLGLPHGLERAHPLEAVPASGGPASHAVEENTRVTKMYSLGS